MKLLADDWLAFVREQAQSLPERPGASLVMQHVVSAGPAGKVHCQVEVRDGRLVQLAIGKRADASCTITWTYEDAVAVLRGGDLDVAVMQGRVKLDGDYRSFLLDLRPVFASAEGAAFVDSVRAATED